jgi:hypothetical protein
LTTQSETTSGRFKQRQWIAGLLVVVSSISILASVIAVWAHNTIFDTDSFMETIEPVLQDPALNAALGDYITEEVTGAWPSRRGCRNRWPTWMPFSPPLCSGFSDWVTKPRSYWIDSTGPPSRPWPGRSPTVSTRGSPPGSIR